MTDMNPYVMLALNGFCTGFGVIVAQHIYELFFKNKVAESKEVINNIKNINPQEKIDKMLGR